MKRRQFIASFSIGAFSFGFFEKKESFFSRGLVRDLLKPHDLLNILKDEQAIIEIGYSFRANNPEENDEACLIDRLTSSVEEHGRDFLAPA